MPDDPNEVQPKGDPAKARFMAINLMRIGGVAMVLIGIVIIQGVLPLPDWVAYILIALGLVEAFIFPTLLARVWSTNDRSGPRK